MKFLNACNAIKISISATSRVPSVNCSRDCSQHVETWCIYFVKVISLLAGTWERKVATVFVLTLFRFEFNICIKMVAFISVRFHAGMWESDYKPWNIFSCCRKNYEYPLTLPSHYRIAVATRGWTVTCNLCGLYWHWRMHKSRGSNTKKKNRGLKWNVIRQELVCILFLSLCIIILTEIQVFISTKFTKVRIS